jgi:hypothetical protein
MALPLIAAGVAARAIAKKLATRAVGGITGAGAKQVAPVYRNMSTGSVTKIPKVTDYQQNIVNKQRTMSAQNAKSGKTAKRLSSEREQANIDTKKYFNEIGAGVKPKPIKINSNPTRAR